MRPTVFTRIAVLLLLAAGCVGSPTAQLEANKGLVRRFVEVGNAADWEGVAAVVTENFQRHSAATPGPAVTSRAEFIQLQQSFVASMPDQHVAIQQLVAEGDRVAVLATYSGTQSGPMGDFPATGKHFESPFLAMFRIDGGKIAELWVEWDNVHLLSQLGLFSPTPPSGG